jgi:hypothetical protein
MHYVAAFLRVHRRVKYRLLKAVTAPERATVAMLIPSAAAGCNRRYLTARVWIFLHCFGSAVRRPEPHGLEVYQSAFVGRFSMLQTKDPWEMFQCL